MSISLHISFFASRDKAEKYYLEKADTTAEKMRAQHLTLEVGQGMTYEAKYREAERYPQGQNFPFMQRESEALGITLQAVVESILTEHGKWESIGAEIEAKRLKAKKDIRLAQNAEQMDDIVKAMSL